MILETRYRPTFGRCLLPLLAVLSLGLPMGCSTMSIAPSPELKVKPDEACLTPADPLPQLTDGTMPGLVQLLVDVADSYHILAARHACLAEFERSR